MYNTLKKQNQILSNTHTHTHTQSMYIYIERERGREREREREGERELSIKHRLDVAQGQMHGAPVRIKFTSNVF